MIGHRRYFSYLVLWRELSGTLLAHVVPNCSKLSIVAFYTAYQSSNIWIRNTEYMNKEWRREKQGEEESKPNKIGCAIIIIIIVVGFYYIRIGALTENKTNVYSALCLQKKFGWIDYKITEYGINVFIWDTKEKGVRNERHVGRLPVHHFSNIQLVGSKNNK